MSDIRFRLGLDSKPFSQGLNNARREAGQWGASMDQVGKQVQRTFSAKNLFAGLLQGAGIGSVLQIVDTIKSGFAKAAEHARDLAESSARTLGLYEQLFRNRRTDSQNLAANLREQERLQKELAGIEPKGRTRTVMGADFRPRTVTEGPSAESIRESETKRAQIAERLAALAVEEDQLKKRVAETDKKHAQEVQKAATDQAKLLDQLASVQRDNARALMSDEAHILDLKAEQAELIEKAASGQGEWARHLIDAAKLEREILSLEERRSREAERQRKEAEKLNKELEAARKRETAARAQLRASMADQFSFTLAEAKDGTRGSPGARAKAKLIDQKTRQMEQILDRGEFTPVFDDKGRPTLSTTDPTRRDAARQATERFRTLHSSREQLRGSMANLDKADRDPLANEIKAVEKATQDVKSVLEEIRDGKFVNQ
jgi:hypothetical protein